MKIGIITQPLYYNYGGILQNFALQKALNNLGHEVITLDQYGAKNSALKNLLVNLKLLFLRLLGKNVKYVRQIKEFELEKICLNTKRFIDNNIRCTPKLKTDSQFRQIIQIEELEVLIVGSDQVWRPMYNADIKRSYFNFAKGIDVKRIAYAASFGVDFWEYTQYQTVKSKELIHDFDAVSVREYSGIDLCRKYLNCDAVHVLDPTMLLDKEDYIRLVASENNLPSKGNMFVYILDDSEEKKQIIDKVASIMNLNPFSTMPKYVTDVFPPVTQWLRSFIDADFVVCDSFHGAVFSIIFNKPFLIIGNKERGMTRFNSLLNTFDLNERMITDIENVYSVLHSPIDWVKVNRIRTELKSYSLEFLKSTLIK